MGFARGRMHERGQAFTILRCMAAPDGGRFTRSDCVHKSRSYGADAGSEQKAGEFELLSRRCSVENHSTASRY